MSFLQQITVLLLTYNEAPNIGRTLEALRRFPEILVLDSGSTDQTLQIVASYRNTQVVSRPFDDFASQCNFGLSQISKPWVLSLDADYELSPALVDEIDGLQPSEVAGLSASFVYRIHGRPLRASLYPPRVVLYRRKGARYCNEGHAHRVTITGRIDRLNATIYHDDRKPLSQWLVSQQRYARKEADHLITTPLSQLSYTDRIRLMGWLAPLLVLPYTLMWKRCLLDGWPGWLYVLQRTLAETMIALEIVDRKVSGKAR